MNLAVGEGVGWERSPRGPRPDAGLAAIAVQRQRRRGILDIVKMPTPSPST